MDITYKIKNSIKQKGFFQDSAVMLLGNGLGNGLMLVAGIIVARILGNDLYGQYGLVKTTMFYIASLSTFGLGFSITKYVSTCVSNASTKLKSYIYYSIQITLAFSLFLAILLILFSKQIALFLNEPSLTRALSFLAIIIVVRALNTCMIGILAGLKDFKTVAINVTISGLTMLLLALPLTHFYSLYGALIALLASQGGYLILNIIHIKKVYIGLDQEIDKSTRKELLLFSIPIAMQEMSFMVCNWGISLMIPKLCSFGEYGIYSAANQWNAIILYIPSVLTNVILSYLSSTVGNKNEHNRTLGLMTKVNFVSALIPFIVVSALSMPITRLYGPTFNGLNVTLVVIVFSTVFVALSNVYSSELISHEKVWPLFFMRFSRDLIIFLGSFLVITLNIINSGATSVAVCTVVANILFFFMLIIYYNNYLKLNE